MFEIRALYQYQSSGLFENWKANQLSSSIHMFYESHTKEHEIRMPID
ncbi:MAG: hypothetical protein DDT32_01921 [Syntrophomonadaceae bacterium]|nr:hypothetical protein [Bacillota bacterium]